MGLLTCTDKNEIKKDVGSTHESIEQSEVDEEDM